MPNAYTVIILRPITRTPRPGWRETMCPACGRTCWDSDVDGSHAEVLRKYGDVYKLCGPCDVAWVTGERGVQMRLEVV